MNGSARVLAVDDEAHVREVLRRWLSQEGYECETAASGEEALTVLEESSYQVVLLDIDLPGMSGMDLLGFATQRFDDLSVIMATGIGEEGMARRCLELGAHGYLLKPFDQREVVINVAAALEERRRSLEARTENDRLEREVRARTEEVRRREEEIALRLVAAAEYRDEESGAHIRRIGMFAEVLARALGWNSERVDDIRIAATMHDIGKIGVPDGILLKPAPLLPEEFEVVKLHTDMGANMLAGSDIALLQMAEEIARSHHEKWDGSGYPHGSAADSIPEPARIVAVADVYDSLTHARTDRPAFSEVQALEIMHRGRSRHFDPEIFDVFLEALPALRRVREAVADASPLPAPRTGDP